MSEHCPVCNAAVTIAQRTCPVCEADLGFPNVRYASRPEETSALDRRFDDARSRTQADGLGSEFDALVAAANRSDAVFNRWLGQLHSWVTSQDKRFRCFHERVRGGAPFEEDEWNRQRCAAEAAISPFFYDQLNIAALSLNGVGMRYYGDYTVVLDEKTIGHRASVFEENPFEFNRKHQVIAGQAPPSGYRAPWNDKGRLAGAKLAARLQPGMNEDSRASLLMGSNDEDAECDFIEVHIYGPVHTKSIAKVVGPVPDDDVERSIWGYVRKRLEEIGTEVEELP